MPEAVNLELSRSRAPDGPYPGLRPFEPHEWSIFFGREVMAAEVIAKLGEQNLIIVHGSSGCGKSSLVRAGILPALQSDHDLNRQDFRYSIIRPSQGPLDALADALLAQLGPANGKDLEESWLDRIAVERDLVETIERRLDGSNATFCLVVDQFEEIFRWAEERDRAEAEYLVDFMRNVARRDAGNRNFFILVTMRSDYLGQCAQFNGFAGVVNQCQYLLDNLDEFGILRAIHEPADRFGGSVDPALADRLRFIAKDDADALPILQHTLMRMYEALPDHEPGWTLGLSSLAEASGEHGPLSEHAETIYQETVAGSPERAVALEWMFRALTDLDAGGRAIRRPCRLGELVAVSGTDEATVRDLADAFARPGRNFLVIAASARGGEEIDISHEALIRRWRRLGDNSVDADTGLRSGWVFREFQAGLIWKALAVFAKREETALEPAMTRQWLPFFGEVEGRPAWAARYFVDPLPGVAPAEQPEWTKVMALIAASRARFERENQAWRRFLFRSWAFLAAAAALFLLGGLLYGLQLARKAKDSTLIAEKAERATELARRETRASRTASEAAQRQSERAGAEAVAARRFAESQRRASRALIASARLDASEAMRAVRTAQSRELEAKRNEDEANRNVNAALAYALNVRNRAEMMRQQLSQVDLRTALSTQSIVQSLAPLTRRQEEQAARFAAAPPVALPADFRAGLSQVLQVISRGRGDISAIADQIEAQRGRYGLTTDKRLAAFLAILAIDSDGFTSLEEQFDFASAEEVTQRYGPLLPDPSQAGTFVRRPRELANAVYDGRLGNDEPGDGWTFRGRGLIPLRGRAEYAEMDFRIAEDLIANPDLLTEPRLAVQAAMERWSSREGSMFTDNGRIFWLWRIFSARRPQPSDLLFFDLEYQVRTAISRSLNRAPASRF